MLGSKSDMWENKRPKLFSFHIKTESSHFIFWSVYITFFFWNSKKRAIIMTCKFCFKRIKLKFDIYFFDHLRWWSEVSCLAKPVVHIYSSRSIIHKFGVFNCKPFLRKLLDKISHEKHKLSHICQQEVNFAHVPGKKSPLHCLSFVKNLHIWNHSSPKNCPNKYWAPKKKERKRETLRKQKGLSLELVGAYPESISCNSYNVRWLETLLVAWQLTGLGLISRRKDFRSPPSNSSSTMYRGWFSKQTPISCTILGWLNLLEMNNVKIQVHTILSNW